MNKYLLELQDELFTFKEELERIQSVDLTFEENWHEDRRREVFLYAQIKKLRLEIKHELIKELETTGFIPKKENKYESN